jgi:3-oxoacyl-[acyl-carrier-protein] synthase II
MIPLPRFSSTGVGRSARRVWITGIGVLSPNGVGRRAFWESTRVGRSGLSSISLFDASNLPCRVAGEVRGVDLEGSLPASERRRVSRAAPMGVLAAREALEDAGLPPGAIGDELREQIGVLIGSGAGGIEYAERQYRLYYENRLREVNPYAIPSSFAGTLSSEVSMALGLHGPSHVVSNGCSSSSDALGYALDQIRLGRADIKLAGGVEACITPGIMAGFCRMRVVSTAFNAAPTCASRPFDRARDGFVLGEGAWLFVLEEERHARRRGARPYAELAGYGSTCDAYHRVALAPNAVHSARAIRLALEDAGLPAEQIDYVNAHGTSTPMNDPIETRALKAALGEHARSVPISSSKSLVGHPQGACGALGVAAAALALFDGFIPPTLNLENPDPECDLDYVPQHGRCARLRAALCNCISFGSKNSALVLRRVD